MRGQNCVCVCVCGTGGGGSGGVGVFHIGRFIAGGGGGGTKLMFLPFSQVCAIIFL